MFSDLHLFSEILQVVREYIIAMSPQVRIWLLYSPNENGDG